MLDKPTWRDRFPGLGGLSPTVSELLDQTARSVFFEQDTVIFGPGKPAEHLLLMVSGTVRV
ncbi:MAG: hypothetical protein AB8B60_14545 [Sulfitobacter sp.]